jgi:hypothetical protein
MILGFWGCCAFAGNPTSTAAATHEANIPSLILTLKFIGLAPDSFVNVVSPIILRWKGGDIPDASIVWLGLRPSQWKHYRAIQKRLSYFGHL